MVFFNQEEDYAGGIGIRFSSTLQYRLLNCSDFYSETEFRTAPPTETETAVWKITYDRTSGGRVTVHCYGVQVINTRPSDDTCIDAPDWRTYWSENVRKIRFTLHNTASYSYEYSFEGNETESV